MRERTRETPRESVEPREPDTLPEEAEPELLVKQDEDTLRSRWTEIQSGFVDEPARAVQQADELVSAVMARITDVFARERAKLEEQWARKEQTSTESLRVVLQRYRSFFDRLLGMTTH